MNKENFAFPIPNEVLEPYIKSAVSTAIVAALGDGTELVRKAVHAALSQKVNSKGVVDQYDSYNKHNFVEIVASGHIRKIAQETVQEMAEQMRPQIQEHVTKYLEGQTSEISRCLVDGLVSSLKSDWNVKVHIGKMDD